MDKLLSRIESPGDLQGMSRGVHQVVAGSAANRDIYNLMTPSIVDGQSRDGNGGQFDEAWRLIGSTEARHVSCRDAGGINGHDRMLGAERWNIPKFQGKSERRLVA